MKTPQQYWQQFQAAFCQALDQTSEADFKQAWEKARNKTHFYEFNNKGCIAAERSGASKCTHG